MKTLFIFASLMVGVFLFGSVTSQAQTRSTKSVTTQKATTEDGREVVLKSNGTWQYAQKPTVDVTVNFQGKYQADHTISTANNTYGGAEQLTIKKAIGDTYDWTLEVFGYQTFYVIYGTCKAEKNIAECSLSGSKDGDFVGGAEEIERIKNIGQYFTLKMAGNSLLTKWAKVYGETNDPQYKGFIRYFKKVSSFKDRR